jgi:hypothetical protein
MAANGNDDEQRQLFQVIKSPELFAILSVAVIK